MPLILGSTRNMDSDDDQYEKETQEEVRALSFLRNSSSEHRDQSADELISSSVLSPPLVPRSLANYKPVYTYNTGK